MRKTVNDAVFDFVDSASFLIEKDEKVADYLKKLSPHDKVVFAYNQYDFSYSRSACTLFAPLGIISSMFNIQVTPEQEEDMFRFAQAEYGYKEGEGNSSNNGARAVCKWRNKNFPNNQVVFFSDILLSDTFKLSLEKGLGVQTTIRASSQFFAALQSGYIKTATNMKGKRGHCIALYNHGGYYFHDSDRKGSKGQLSLATLEELARGMMYQACRVFLPLEKLSVLSVEEYKAIKLVMQANSNAWKYVDDEDKKLLNDTNNHFRDKYAIV